MLPPGLQTPREVTLYYDSLYHSLIDSGEATPFLYPWAGLGAFVIFGYLLIDHRQSPTLTWLRFPLFVFLVLFQGWCIMTNKAKNPAALFGIGLVSSWGVLWVAAILIAKDCQFDFKRIERDERIAQVPRKDIPMMSESTLNGTLSHSRQNAEADLGTSTSDTASQTSLVNSGPLYWQQYPAKVLQRLDWVADVFCSFRGVGWNWQTSGVPRLPKSIEFQLRGSVDSKGQEAEMITRSKTGIRRFSNRSSLLNDAVTNLGIAYFALDLIKTLMHNDAYFWGYMDAAPPSNLPDLIQGSHVLVKSYRLLVSLAGLYTSLWVIFKLGPLFFCGMLGPDRLGVRGEAWMNPADMFGSFQCVLNNGLAGWWGGWWHQAFRVAFEAPSNRLFELLEIDKRSETGKVISLFLAFFLSGCLHACGSYTQMGETRPLMGPMRFFLLQPLGIMIQTLSVRQLSTNGVSQKTPKAFKQLANFVFVHTWLYFTAPLLTDDFAKGGVWLFEPIAISPLRGLGLGAKDDSWFCWWNGILFWRSGKHWWDTGIAL